MSPLVLLQLTENDKRLIFALLLVVILVIVLIGYLGFLLTRLMKWQGKKMDTLIHDVVVSKLITDKKHLIRYGRVKNYNLFFKQAYIPVIIMTVAAIILIVHNSITRNWLYNPFSTEDGFGTIFWTWKLSNEYTEGSLIKFNKLVIDNTPHLAGEAWAGYIAAPCLLVGGTWYFIVVLSFLSRTFMLYKRSKEVFEKSLEGFNQTNQVNVEQPSKEDSVI